MYFKNSQNNNCILARFILDNKLATMYSSGSPEGGSDSSENRGEFLEKLQRARASVKPSTSGPVELFKVGRSEVNIDGRKD